MWNSAREAARDASLGEDNLQTVATNLLTYLQGAEPTAFGLGPFDHHDRSGGHPAGEHDRLHLLGQHRQPGALHHDVYGPHQSQRHGPDGDAASSMCTRSGFRFPTSSISLSPLSQITGMSRLSVTVVWASMVDTPFQITPYLPAQ